MVVSPGRVSFPAKAVSDCPNDEDLSSGAPLRAAWTHRADAQRRLTLGGRFPPYLVLLRVGFTLPRPLQDGRCALTAPFHPYPGAGVCRNGKRTRQAGPTRVLRFQGGPPTASEETGEG